MSLLFLERTRGRMNPLLGLLALILMLASPAYAMINFSSPSTNPYKVLGLSTSANLEQIKRRYRTLAKEHHPDKGGNPEMFAKIANAYEILSDKDKRRQFDQQNQFQHAWNQQQEQQQRNAHRRAQQEQERQEKERQKQKMKHALLMQRHLLRFHTMEDLYMHGILDKDNIFQKHFLGVFVGNKVEEKIVDDKFMFPYPFWGEARNGMKWQDVIQLAKIRVNKETDLTTFFDVPQRARTMPHVVFVPAGHSMQHMRVFTLQNLHNAQEQLEAWVRNQMVMRVTFVNRHYSAVNLFMVTDQALLGQQPPILLHTLKAGQAISLGFQVGDKIVAVDARVDAYPGSSPFDTSFFQGYPDDKFNKSPNPDSWYFKNPAILGEYLIGLTTTEVIEEEHCFDLSLKCQSWTLKFRSNSKKQHLKCQQQPQFMHHICPASCGICQRNSNQWFETLRYSLQHAPIHQWPGWLRPVVKFSRYMFDDLLHLWGWRRTIAFVFLATGATLGLNVFILPCCLWGSRFKCCGYNAPKFSWLEGISLGLLASVLLFWSWVQFGTLSSHSSLRRDWDHILGWQMDALFGLVVWGMACLATYKITLAIVWKRNSSMTLKKKLWLSSFVLIIFAASTIVAVMVSFALDSTSSRVRRWQHLWRFRKNLSCALVFTGVVLGMVMPALWKGICKYPALVVVTLLDAGVLVALDWISLHDVHFMEDLNHVLQMRMSAAIPIGVLGMVLGIGVPFTFVKSFPVQVKATIPTEPIKLKND